MASRSWAQERAKRKGGSNIRGNKREPWEKTRVSGYSRRKPNSTKRIKVSGYSYHKTKRR
jgi:hypothetical protein